MNDKQIFAAVEVADHEVRMVVGEFFNTRFNILKVERVATEGITYNEITDPEKVTAAIRKAADETEKMLGVPIQQVILAVPSVNMRRKSVKARVPVEGIDGVITVQDIRNAIKNAETVSIDKNLALIETVCIRYTVDGIASRRLPIGERANELTVDIDLLCADRNMAFTLCGCVEKAGLSIMDIFLDVYSAAKEAALFEQSVDRNVVLLKMEREATSVGLLSKGRLREATIIPMGVGSIAGAVVDKYGLKREEACELVKYSALLDSANPSDSPVHVWSDNGNANKLTEKELLEAVSGKAAEWLDTMTNLCSGILQAGPTAVIITGEGGEMQGLSALLQKRLGCEVRNYIPETLGGRNAGLTACLGLFYAYKDKLPITGYTFSSVDLDEFLKAVSYRDKKENAEDTLTGKLKGMFSNNKR